MISYLPTFMPTKVLIIGGGGTGSRLVPLLAQFLKTCAWIPNPEITIVDDDIVEEKNLLRQNFIAQDVGKHKAVVLAQRYSRAFNIPITPVVQRITEYVSRYSVSSGQTLEQIQEQNNLFVKHANNSIVVMCVDSPEARRAIVGNVLAQSGNIHGGGNILLLDSGNENDFGQVSVSTAKICDFRYEGETLKGWGNTVTAGDFQIPLIPIDLKYYREMVAETTLSCADLDQTMAINTMMAVTMFGIIQNFYYAKPISYHRLNVSLSHGITPQYISPKFLLENGTPHSSMIIDKKFTKAEFYVPMAQIFDLIHSFNSKTVVPFKRQVTFAEKAQKAAEATAEQTRIDKIKAAAVEEAMMVNGWKLPKAKEAQLPPNKKELEKLIAQDLEKAMLGELTSYSKSSRSSKKQVTLGDGYQVYLNNTI